MTRNISEKAVNAFNRFVNFKQSNTRVENDERDSMFKNNTKSR